MIIRDPAMLARLVAAIVLYEARVTAHDAATRDALRHDAAGTLFLRTSDLLYGFAGPAAFRRTGPGGSPARRALRRTVTSYGMDFGTAHLEFRRTGSRRFGRQSRSWVRIGQ